MKNGDKVIIKDARYLQGEVIDDRSKIMVRLKLRNVIKGTISHCWRRCEDLEPITPETILVGSYVKFDQNNETLCGSVIGIDKNEEAFIRLYGGRYAYVELSQLTKLDEPECII